MCIFTHRMSYDMNKNFWVWFLVGLLLVAGCRKNTDTKPETGATVDIMVVFAPGQLGDRGYADSVMDGLALLNQTDKDYGHNMLELEFISRADAAQTQASMAKWLKNPENPFYGNKYEKRLLVLTEPFMVQWLVPEVSAVRPEDEVLLLKVDETDVDAAAKATGLGERIHGLNISAAANIRRYCDFINRYCQENECPLDEVPIFRVFNEESGFYQYRDGVVSSFQEYLAEEVLVYTFSLEDELDGEEDLLDTQKQSAVMEKAYEMAEIMHDLCEDYDSRFAVVELGSANTGFDYYLLGQAANDRLQHLMIDASPMDGLNRYWVNRRFDKALLLWGFTWSQNPVGTMPKMDLHSQLDGYSDDNLPLN